MKTIIYGLALMLISPLFYLGGGKKQGRLILGIIVAVILLIGYFLPGKMAFYLLKKELKNVEKNIEDEGGAEKGKEENRKAGKKMEEALKNTLQQEITPENQEKISLEKEIIKWKEELEKTYQESDKLKKEEESYGNNPSPSALETRENIKKKLDEEIHPRMTKAYKLSEEKARVWARKGGGKKALPSFLFCGEEFNYELTKVRKVGKGSGQIVYDRDYHSDVIDFSKFGNVEPTVIKDKIRKIGDYGNSGISRGRIINDYPIIFLKNIDKITNSELEKELLLIIGSENNTKYDKYPIKHGDGKTIGEGNVDLSRFVFVATTSTSNPRISNDLRKKLNHIEPFLDKYFWMIVFSSLGIEVIVFILIKKFLNNNKG